MLEIVLLIAVCVSVAKMASNDGQSGGLFGGITMLIALGLIVTMPFPFLRVLLAGAIGVVALIGYRVAFNK